MGVEGGDRKVRGRWLGKGEMGGQGGEKGNRQGKEGG